MEFIKRKLRIKTYSEKRGWDGDSASKDHKQFSDNKVDISAAIISAINDENENYDPSVWDQPQTCRHVIGGSRHQMKKSRLGGLLAGADDVIKGNDSKSNQRRDTAKGDDHQNKSKNKILSDNRPPVFCQEDRWTSVQSLSDQADAGTLLSSCNYSRERQFATGRKRRRTFEEHVEFTCDVVEAPPCIRDCAQCSGESQYVLVTATPNKQVDSGRQVDDWGVLENEVDDHVTDQVTFEDASEPGRMQSSFSSSSLYSDSLDSATSNSATHGSYTLRHGGSDDGSENGCSDDDDDDPNENYLTPENSSIQRVCTCQNQCECVSSRGNSLKRKLVPLLRDFESNDSINSTVEFEVKPKVHHPSCESTVSSALVKDLSNKDQIPGVDNTSRYQQNPTSTLCTANAHVGADHCKLPVGCEFHNQSSCTGNAHVGAGCKLPAGCEFHNQSVTKTKSSKEPENKSENERKDYYYAGAEFVDEEFSQRNVPEVNSAAEDGCSGVVCSSCDCEESSILHSDSYGSCASSWNAAINPSEHDTCLWEDASDFLPASQLRTSDNEETSGEVKSFEMVELVAGSESSVKRGSSGKTNVLQKLNLIGLGQNRSGKGKVAASSRTGLAPMKATSKQVESPDMVVAEKTKDFKIISRVKGEQDLESTSSKDMLSTSEGSTPGAAMDADCSTHVAWTLANNAAAIILLLDHKM